MKTFKLPDFTLPALLTRLGPRLPQLPPTLVLVGALNAALRTARGPALGHLLPKELLEPLIGRRVTLRVLDAGMTLRFAYGERGFRPSFDNAPADLTMSARTRDFLALLLREEDADTLFFGRRLLMEGDTELGLLVKNTLDGIDLPRFDLAQLSSRLAPAELLSRLGEYLARRAVPHH